MRALATAQSCCLFAGAATPQKSGSSGARPTKPAKVEPAWEPEQVIRLELRAIDQEEAKEEGRFAAMYGTFVDKARAGRQQLSNEEEAMKVCTPFDSQPALMLGKGPREYPEPVVLFSWLHSHTSGRVAGKGMRQLWVT